MSEPASREAPDPGALETMGRLEVINAIEDDLRTRGAAGTLTRKHYDAALARALAAAGDERELVATIRELQPDEG